MSEPSSPHALSPEELGFQRIVYDKAPPRATIRLNRPERLNAFDFRMLREIARAAEDASWDDDIRVVVLTGTGRAFCVGADLQEWQADYLGRPQASWKWFGAFMDAHDRLREIGKPPTLARINGICVGGGNELQMACDLAVMVEDASIRHIGLEHGSVPAGGATQWLPVMVGERRARQIVLLCEEIPARRAEEWGLVNRAVPTAELDAAVDELAEKLAAKLPQTTRTCAASSSAARSGPSPPGPISARWGARRRSRCTSPAASNAGTRSAACRRRLSPPSPASRRPASASSPGPAAPSFCPAPWGRPWPWA